MNSGGPIYYKITSLYYVKTEFFIYNRFYGRLNPFSTIFIKTLCFYWVIRVFSLLSRTSFNLNNLR